MASGRAASEPTSGRRNDRDRVTTSALPIAPLKIDHGDGRLEIRVDGICIQRVPYAITESLRYLLAGRDELPSRMAVTSAIHGEGVTTISRALAALLAYDKGRSVCWVDVNWWGQDNVSLDVEASTTLADVLSGAGEVADLPSATSIPNLYVSMAGEVPVASRSRHASSSALELVLQQLSTHFDHLILDVPPILVTSDALSISGLADAYLMVVRQGATAAAQVRSAVRTMAAVPSAGIVLNASSAPGPRWVRRLTAQPDRR